MALQYAPTHASTNAALGCFSALIRTPVLEGRCMLIRNPVLMRRYGLTEYEVFSTRVGRARLCLRRRCETFGANHDFFDPESGI
eukprot:3095207-Rhodomonas_salina.2